MEALPLKDEQSRRGLAHLPVIGLCGGSAADRTAWTAALEQELGQQQVDARVYSLNEPCNVALEETICDLCQRYAAVVVKSPKRLPFAHLWVEKYRVLPHGLPWTQPCGMADVHILGEQVAGWLDDQWARPPVWGCVLVGGKSRRMGRAKHLIRRNGATWVERAVEVLSSKVAQVVISGEGVLPSSLSHLQRVKDAEGLAGPLAGILALLRWRSDVAWLVVACDLPLMNEAALQWLLDQRGIGRRAILPDLEGRGRVEPLLAYYDFRCRGAVESIAAQGSLRINRLRDAEGIFTPQPPVALRQCWCNVNTPRELAPHR